MKKIIFVLMVMFSVLAQGQTIEHKADSLNFNDLIIFDSQGNILMTSDLFLLAGNIFFADNQPAFWGADLDLQINYSGSGNYITSLNDNSFYFANGGLGKWSFSNGGAEAFKVHNGNTTSFNDHIVNGNVTAGADSTKGVILHDSAGIKWRLKVQTNGTVEADSTGLN